MHVAVIITTVGVSVTLGVALVTIGLRIGGWESKFVKTKDFRDYTKALKEDLATCKTNCNHKLEVLESNHKAEIHDIHKRIDEVLEAIKNLAVTVAGK